MTNLQELTKSSRKACITKNRLHSLLHLTAFMLVVAFSCPAFVVSPDVVISHYPAQADMLTGESTLILAGHSHGGQVRLPLFGPLVLPPEVGSYDMGLFKTPAGQLHVSTGLGTSTIPVRFNCRPEITIVEV